MLVAFKMILMRPVCEFTFLEQGALMKDSCAPRTNAAELPLGSPT